LTAENYSNNLYFDADVINGTNCYRVILLDQSGNESFSSIELCTEINSLADINQDGIVNVVDLVLLVEMILTGSPYSAIADLNSDGEINVVDVVELVELILAG